MDEQAAATQEPTGTEVEETPVAEPDPFAEVASDPLGEGDLPGGVVPGSLGGDNPSEEQAKQEAEAAAVEEAERAGAEPEAEPEPEPVEPEPEPTPEPEFLEEPPEPEDLAPPIDVPADPPPSEEPEPIAAEEPPPVEPPVAEGGDTGADPATPVGGNGESPLRGDSPASEEPADSPPPPPADPLAEPPAEPETGTAEPVEPSAAEPEPDAKPEPKKKKRKPRKKKAEKGRRGYVILRLSDRTETVVDGASYPIWVEAFKREIPMGEDGSEPVTIDTRSGEMALRVAYRQLTDNGEGSYELVAVPVKLFKPKKVEGKVPETALTIKVQ